MSKMPSRRALAQQRRLKVLLRAGLEPDEVDTRPVVPRVPKVAPVYVTRDSSGQLVGLTPDGLAKVERLAGTGTPQMRIASVLGIAHKQLKNLMAAERGENPVRLAWEAGFSRFEEKLLRLLLKHSQTSFVAAIFLAKSRAGWSDEAQETKAMIQSNVQLMLPKPHSRESFFKMMGCVDPKTITGGSDTLQVVGESPPLALPAPSESESETPTQPASEPVE